LFIVSGHCDTAYISAIPNPKVICHLSGKLWKSIILHKAPRAADVKTGFLRFLIVAAVAFGLLLWRAWLGGEQLMQIREIAVQPQTFETGSRH
jgi:hypothetical protein